MKRHDQEVFGVEDINLANIAESIFQSAYEDSIVQDSNDAVRTGFYEKELPYTPYEKKMAARNLI